LPSWPTNAVCASAAVLTHSSWVAAAAFFSAPIAASSSRSYASIETSPALLLEAGRGR
jgi:hypothetical protein